MPPTPYKLHRILKKSPRGITTASLCAMSAILKFDGEESPYCVYNEQVASLLAQTLHVPSAIGIVTTTPAGQAFASLKIAGMGIPLPDLSRSAIPKVAERYPDEVGALVAFDIFIGNWDRGKNLKASVVSSHIHLFQAFDHSHCLLTVEDTAEDSLRRLADGSLIVKFHPFYGHVERLNLYAWAQRIAELDDRYIAECCQMGRVFNAVTKVLQDSLTEALISRKRVLIQIIQTAIVNI